MTWTSRLVPGALAGLLALGPAPGARAAAFDPGQRSEIERIIHDYLVQHPEVLQEAIEALETKRNEAQSAAQKQAMEQNREKLFESPRQVVLGNPQGDVTMVEFFDYNCGYCRRALTDMLELIREDPKLRVVLKEFPVLGPGSTEAARVSIALKRQGNDKYLAFHQKMLGDRGEANEQRALDTAKSIGADMARLRKDMADPEVQATLEESFKLANALGLTGTPSYVIGQGVVPGAVGAAALKEKIGEARAACGATC